MTPAAGAGLYSDVIRERWRHPRFRGELPGASATAEDVIAFTRDRLAHFKAPKGVTFLPELPKTATGKVQKYVLRGGRPAIARQ